ncbi:hypothetical protein [Oceanobacillus neutriphilus]|uniref:ABC transporter permease n=1 Tax=Oceanobacillus neutriphilus TaxID=531815 RepID=A0ABQ2NZ95_9BACI|nr:hypothetical protein [Oceanobacillus neutriphilus]GGP13989.1 ABC transporter permease [Oceanobacillus neutriphilus]
MKDVIKYSLHDYIRSHKYFPPISTFFVLILVFYTYKPNPIVDSYAITALFLFVISAWLCLSVLSLDSPVQRQLMILHLGSSYRYYSAKLLTVMLIAVLLTVFAFLYPIIFNMFPDSVSLAVGFISFVNHLLLAALGICVASFFSKVMMESAINAYGGLVLTIILSIAALGIENVLPASFKYTVWLLPPATITQRPLIQWEEESLSSISYLPFLWIVIYTVIILLLFLIMANRRR